MALTSLQIIPPFSHQISSLKHQKPTKISLTFSTKKHLFTPKFTYNSHFYHHNSSLHNKPTKKMQSLIKTSAFSSPIDVISHLVQSSPATWQSAIVSNVVIFVLGTPLLVAGLSLSGIATAFLLGVLTWRAFGSSGFLLVATYFVLQFSFGSLGKNFLEVAFNPTPALVPLGNDVVVDFGDLIDVMIPYTLVGTAATKVKMAQKEAQGVAEKRKGRRGPGSVIGSSAAGCVCAYLSTFGIGGKALSQLWQLGFVASFCTKLSDTVSSEIGKAYGKTTYLVTTFKVVPRGTEGAVSVEGTLAGFLASILLACIGCLTGQINTTEAAVCVLASQLANFGESIIGALFQEKDGFKWLNNDAVNIINISLGSILAIVLQQVVTGSWLRL